MICYEIYAGHSVSILMKTGEKEMVISIKEKGAMGDGETINTEIIQGCIDLCYASGGGTVLVEGGVYVTGTLYMKSNVRLEIDQSAVLLASPDISHYGTDTHYNRYRNEHNIDRCWIYAEEQENFSIGGRGMLDGNAEKFPNEGSIYRPMMLRFLRCRNIRIDEIRLYHAAAWTTAFLDSSYIWVTNVEIKNSQNYNGDGLDFDGCAHVFVRGCSITGTDDNLCLQAGNSQYPTEHVHISDCEFTSLCAGIRIGMKSIGDIRNVTITNCTMRNIWREGIKIECSEGGSISDIAVSNIAMRNVRRPLFVLLNNRFRPDDYGSSIELSQMPEIGKMERLLFCGITIYDEDEMKNTHYRFGNDIMGSPRFNGIRLDAEENHKIKDVVIRDLFYVAVGGVKQEEIPADYPCVLDMKQHEDKKVSENYYPDFSRTACMDIRNVDNLHISGVTFKVKQPDERPIYLMEGCGDGKWEIKND